ncbi:cobalamin biosynthesis protein [Frankia sp. AgKG'84/4]|uniref:cobalamin biosynthesis protein n=1 Tax=Frankia sp. AgKG'84/4 TaxID=573490 RepID=UPI00200DDB57|nr:cobalamin biosynthesis protein [Frankia sp. AgKG'84/4]MCL9798365.1 cobalamin biosynthesis protein [Frankia sp. AgKG'84/4]
MPPDHHPDGADHPAPGTDRPAAPAPQADLVLGVGARPGATAAQILTLIDDALRTLAVAPTAVLALATVTHRQHDPGLRAAAAHHGWPLLAHPPARLATIPVTHPSAAAQKALGIPGVAETACLIPLHPSPGLPAPRLILPKRVGRGVTLAVARHHRPPAPAQVIPHRPVFLEVADGAAREEHHP